MAPSLEDSHASVPIADSVSHGVVPEHSGPGPQDDHGSLESGAAPAFSSSLLAEHKTVISRQSPSSIPGDAAIATIDPGKILAGESLDHYQLEELVGGGGMGAVFRSRDTRLGRVVAVKVLARDHSDPETVRRFQNEAQSAARLDHPNIARVYFVGECKGWNYIVFEFVDGVNVRDLVQQHGPLPVSEALEITTRVAEALQHASDRSVVHRDVKPSNVLVTNNGVVKVVDMGLARFHQVDSSQDDLTASGVTLGTFDYISPEQAIDPRIADVRSDIYSLGCTLYFMVTGRPPFADGTALQKLLRHKGDEPPDARIFRPDLPEPLSLILTKMLAKRPEDRFQTPNELIGVVERIQEDQPDPFQYETSKTRRSMLAPLGLLAATIVLLWAPFLWEMYWSSGGTDNPPLLSELVPGAAPLESTNNSKSQRDEKTKIISKTNDSAKEKLEEPRSTTSQEQRNPKTTEVVPTPSERAIPDGEKTIPSLIRDVGLPLAGKVGPPREFASIEAPLPDTDARLIDSNDRISRIVVVSSKRNPPPGETHVETLEEALLSLSRYSKVSHIEIESNQSQRLGRTEIPPNRSITIRGDDREPIAITSSESDQTERHEWVSIGRGGSLTLIGLHMRLKGDSGTMFRCPTGSKVILRNCVLTIDEGKRASSNSFVEVTNAVNNSLFDAVNSLGNNEPGSENAVVELSRCLVRGDGTFLKVGSLGAVNCEWREGLYAGAGSFLSAKRAMDGLAVSRKLDVDLQRVTIASPEGLVRLEKKNGELEPNSVRLRLSDCVVAVPSRTPLIEISDFQKGDEGAIRFDGSGNVYTSVGTLFRGVSIFAGGIYPQTTLTLRDTPFWRSETSWRTGTLARSKPENLGWSLVGRNDFVLNDDGSLVGHDPQRLPNIESPRESKSGAAIMPPSTMEDPPTAEME